MTEHQMRSHSLTSIYLPRLSSHNDYIFMGGRLKRIGGDLLEVRHITCDFPRQRACTSNCYTIHCHNIMNQDMILQTLLPSHIPWSEAVAATTMVMGLEHMARVARWREIQPKESNCEESSFQFYAFHCIIEGEKIEVFFWIFVFQLQSVTPKTLQ